MKKSILDDTEEIPKPIVSDFIINNGNGILLPDGVYYHFAEVIKLVRLYHEEENKKIEKSK